MIAASTLACRRIRLLAVGGKSAFHHAVLCEIIAQHLESRLHQPVRRLHDLGGARLAHEAVTTGWVDLYPECTGTALTVILKLPADPRPEVTLERVRLEYRNRYRLEWMEPLGFSDGFVMVVLAERARSTSLETLSDATHVEEGWRLGATREFLTQADGMPALMKTYDLRLKVGPKPLSPEQVYDALRKDVVNMVAGTASDGRLRSQDLKVLTDDRRGFPPNQVAVVVRAEALMQQAGLREALAELAGRFTLDQVQEFNERALKGASPAGLAREFLRRTLPAASAPMRAGAS